MKRTRQGFLGNFTSLFRTVQAIADGIPMSDGEADAYRGLNDTVNPDPVLAMLERWPIRRVVTLERAASKLLQHLNRPQTQRPSWYDTALGYALIADHVSNEGLEMLVTMSHQGLAVSTVPNLVQASPAPVVEGHLRPSRIDQIGFVNDELIPFLNAEGIRHSLGPIIGEAVQDVFGGLRSNPLSVPIAHTPVALPRRKFRGPLAEVLQIAVSKARDPNDYVSVFAALCELAIPENRPLPLLGFNSVDRQVLWEEDGTDVPATFEKSDMKSRFRTTKKT